MTVSKRLQVRVLGPLEAEVGAAVVPVGSARQRALLAALVMRPREVVSVDRLAEAIWGEQLPQFATASLRTLVARLRKAFGDAAACLATSPAGYLLVVGDDAIDARAFETGYAAARERLATDPAGAAALLDAALGLWRGEAYGELADGHARPEASRLEQLRLSALEDRAAAALRMGAYGDAVVRAGALVAAHAMRERPVELLMRALHATGRRGEALAAFQRYRSLVADELGLDPSPALCGLEAQILRDDVPPPPAGPGHGTPPPAGTTRPCDPPPRALPPRPSALIGRASQLRSVLGSVRRAPLTTLTGPGGVGKTRLALETAHRLRASGDRVWWVDLATVSADRLVVGLAEAIRVAPGGRHDPRGALCEWLSGLRGVLCLDNAEHLLDALAPIVERLAATSAALSLLITSRERLAVDAETVLVLGPLPCGPGPDSPAVRLFVERSPVLRDTAPTDEDVWLIAQLCRRLDGLPLAIELAAAQATVHGLHGLMSRLGRPLDVLAGGRRTASPRHRTLRAAVAWSHDHLTEDEARLLARLTVFREPFMLDQAVAVCSDELIPHSTVGVLLARLVEQSVVQAAHGRFRLLETIRDYVQERLDQAGDVPRIRSRHRRHGAVGVVA